MKNNFKPFSQNSPTYPDSHPWSQLPVVLLHVASFTQCPLQLFKQPCPNAPDEHSIFKQYCIKN